MLARRDALVLNSVIFWCKPFKDNWNIFVYIVSQEIFIGFYIFSLGYFYDVNRESEKRNS